MRWLLAPFLALACLLGTVEVTSAGEHPIGPEVWFIPNPNIKPDFDELWADDAPWQAARRKVDLLGMLHWWVFYATDDQIRTVTDFAKRHHMRLALGTEPVLRTNATCGQMEGYTWPGMFATVAEKLQRLKIHIDVMDMDEPLGFGHYVSVADGGCALSIPDLSANVASSIAPILALYPGIQIFHTEAIPYLMRTDPAWRDTLSQFQDGLTGKIGKRLSGMTLDVAWDTLSWVQPLKDMKAYTRQKNMRLAWILDAANNVNSDAEWLNNAAKNVEYVESSLGIIPDLITITTWNPYPKRHMPDVWPVGLTSLINHYFRDRTSLEVFFQGRGAHGKLTTTGGAPLANVTVNGYVPGIDFSQPLPATILRGVVPPNAVVGGIGYRLNAECLCDGLNDVLVGPLHYQEIQGGSADHSFILKDFDQTFNAAPNFAFVTNEHVGGVRVSRVIVKPGQSFLPNDWEGIKVTPGAQYTFTVPAASMGTGPWYGRVFLGWFDQNGHRISEISVVPDGGHVLASSAVTGADGSFVLKKLPRVGPGPAPVSVEYAGDETHRPAIWTPPH